MVKYVMRPRGGQGGGGQGLGGEAAEGEGGEGGARAMTTYVPLRGSAQPSH